MSDQGSCNHIVEEPVEHKVSDMNGPSRQEFLRHCKERGIAVEQIPSLSGNSMDIDIESEGG